jgi:uncharacterized Ntn-hydrolase superfamily protein
MSFKTIISLVLLGLSSLSQAQHTFSIVAVDPATGEVGGAGATCYETVNDIADVHPGIGFIHTQSYVNYTNQTLAKQMMDNGLSPQEIMDSVRVVDADNDSTIRQYAAVDLINGGRSAAFTGTNCFDYKGQRLGATYAIAGNILLGPEILDSMESRFNNTEGSLTDKLMASLQGAKVQGADTRCLNNGVSSLSAYIIVAKPADQENDYYLNLNVENVLPSDPIDILTNDYETWKTNQVTGLKEQSQQDLIKFYPTPANDLLTLELPYPSAYFELMNSIGQVVLKKKIDTFSSTINIENLSSGHYTGVIITNNHKTTKSIIIN